MCGIPQTTSCQQSKKYIKSCGCRTKPKFNGKISIDYLNGIEKNANRRNIKYQITHDYLVQLFDSQNGICTLSGMKLVCGGRNNRTASIDRIDSSKGYIEGNLQWVHKDYNMMKLEWSDAEFIQMCKTVTDYQNSKHNTNANITNLI